jgi:hypothetical protein
MRTLASSGSDLLPPVSDTIYAVFLAAGVSKAIAVPDGVNSCIITMNADFWAKFATATGTLAVPTGDILDGSAPSFCPSQRFFLDNVTHLLLVSPAACSGSIEFYD